MGYKLSRSVQYGGEKYGPAEYSGFIPLSGEASEVTSCLDGNNNVVLFCIGTDGNIYISRETDANGAFQPWASLGLPATHLYATRSGNNWMYLFYLDPEGTIHALAEVLPGEGFAAWTSIALQGGPFYSFAVGASQDTTFRIFATALGGNIYYTNEQEFGTAWAPFRPFGGFTTQLVSRRYVDGCLYLFYVGMDGNIYYNFQTSQNSDKVFGTATPPANAWNWGHIDMPGRNTPHADPITQISVESTPAGWEIIGIGSGRDGRGNQIWHFFQTAPHGGFATLAMTGGTARSVLLAPTPQGKLKLFYIGMDSHVYSNTQDTVPSTGKEWPYTPLPGAAELTAVQLTAVMNRHQDVNLFTLGSAAPTGTLFGKLVNAEDLPGVNPNGAALLFQAVGSPGAPPSPPTIPGRETLQIASGQFVAAPDGSGWTYSISGVPLDTSLWVTGDLAIGSGPAQFVAAPGAASPVVLTGANPTQEVDVSVESTVVR